MNWIKLLIIPLSFLFAHAAHARDIERFKDSQGTIHITNVRPKQQGSPVIDPGVEASLPSRSFPGKAPVISPALHPASETQTPGPLPPAVSIGPAPVDLFPAPRVNPPPPVSPWQSRPTPQLSKTSGPPGGSRLENRGGRPG